MLKNAVETIRPPGVEIFMSPVDTVMNPNYIDYIFHPMDLGTISQKVRPFLFKMVERYSSKSYRNSVVNDHLK